MPTSDPSMSEPSMSDPSSPDRSAPDPPVVPASSRWLHRVGGPVVLVTLPVLLTSLVLWLTPLGDVLPAAITRALAVAAGVAGPLFALGLAASYLPRAAVAGAVDLRAPVAGRWVALNSPADRVPSHGTHGYGQTYAIDLVHDPEPGARPTFGSGGGFRPPADFPAFGAPVLAPADATVVRVRQGARDHRTRTTWPAVVVMMLEAMLREVTGPGRILGNHVVLRLDDATYVTLAHLQRGSVEVAPGERVVAGRRLAACGNSGNSSEPHVHLQVTDHPRPTVAAGVPFRFVDVEVEGAADGGPVVPHNDAPFVAGAG
jgi:murein DD-endopeptidase MepM/ murein hydrolase activator NlpD